MEIKTEKSEAKTKTAGTKRDYKPILMSIGKTIGYSFISGVFMAAGSSAWGQIINRRGKLIMLNGGKVVNQ